MKHRLSPESQTPITYTLSLPSDKLLHWMPWPKPMCSMIAACARHILTLLIAVSKTVCDPGCSSVQPSTDHQLATMLPRGIAGPCCPLSVCELCCCSLAGCADCPEQGLPPVAGARSAGLAALCSGATAGADCSPTAAACSDAAAVPDAALSAAGAALLAVAASDAVGAKPPRNLSMLRISSLTNGRLPRMRSSASVPTTCMECQRPPCDLLHRLATCCTSFGAAPSGDCMATDERHQPWNAVESRTEATKPIADEWATDGFDGQCAHLFVEQLIGQGLHQVALL